MKRKRFDRDIWNFGDFPYYQMRVDTDEFHGLVCLLKLMNGNIKVEGGKYQYWNRPKAGKVAICGKGMTWMQLIPDSQEHTLTVKYLPDNTMSICYIDIIENIEYDPDGVAVFIDKYLDVDFTPQGDVSIYDRDELDEAFEAGEISDKQYNAALNECDKVIEKYCSDIPKSIEMFYKILVLVNERIGNGEQLFKSQM
jgi:predicted RNA-binding protein associated with RNAse of E/G family